MSQFTMRIIKIKLKVLMFCYMYGFGQFKSGVSQLLT